MTDPDNKKNTRRGTPLSTALEAAGVAGVMARELQDKVQKKVQELADQASTVVEVSGAAALQLARTHLRKSTITLPLPSPLLSEQITQRIPPRSGIDHLVVSCGDDLLSLQIDGHYRRLVYTLSLDFAVTGCEISDERKELHLQQVNQHFDVQLRQANFAVNWVARQASQRAFQLAHQLPLPTLSKHLMRDIPGIQPDGHRRWRIDLEAAGFMSILEDRVWLLDKLLTPDENIRLPGLSILRDSTDLLQRLVDQLCVRHVRVQTGRLDVTLGLRRS